MLSTDGGNEDLVDDLAQGSKQLIVPKTPFALHKAVATGNQRIKSHFKPYSISHRVPPLLVGDLPHVHSKLESQTFSLSVDKDKHRANVSAG